MLSNFLYLVVVPGRWTLFFHENRVTRKQPGNWSHHVLADCYFCCAVNNLITGNHCDITIRPWQLAVLTHNYDSPLLSIVFVHPCCGSWSPGSVRRFVPCAESWTISRTWIVGRRVLRAIQHVVLYVFSIHFWHNRTEAENSQSMCVFATVNGSTTSCT